MLQQWPHQTRLSICTVSVHCIRHILWRPNPWPFSLHLPFGQAAFSAWIVFLERRDHLEDRFGCQQLDMGLRGSDDGLRETISRERSQRMLGR